jgi:D-alanyl-D-alanine dipeptidase
MTKLFRILLIALLYTAWVQRGVTQSIAPTQSPVAQSIAALRAQALAAQPPIEEGEFLTADLVDLARLDPRLRLDIRYATANNFVHVPVYSSARAFLQRPAALALERALNELAAEGYGVMIFDGYRPWYVTKIFWDATPPEKRIFVADPAKGSRHNRGCAVDLTLYSLATGQPVSMPSGYDEMTERAYPAYGGGTPEERAHRDLLRRAMERQGFTVYASEWWHFDYRDWPHYAVQNTAFEQLP